MDRFFIYICEESIHQTASMNTGITITKGNKGDVEAIARFQVDMAMESEGYALRLETVLKGVELAMEDENKGTYLIARDQQGRAIGSLLLTREWSDWHAAWYWWIQSVYVEPGSRKQGVYTAMYQEVKRRAREEGISQIRLYVDKTNMRGQIVYQHLGMQESHYLIYEEIMD